MQAAANDAPSRGARGLLDDHFESEALAELLGTRDAAALSLARGATWPALAELLARPGKGVRAEMVELCYAIAGEACARAGGRSATPPPPLRPELPQLVELLHAGSLIIDDIEDNALSRRGAPALHRLIGPPRAINAGNFLYFLPLLALEELEPDQAVALAMHRQVARSLLRCHHGQALDLSLRVFEMPRSALRATAELCSSLKTGALLELGCALGALAGRAPPSLQRALLRFGGEMGTTLQMLDDLSGFLNPSRMAKGLEDLLAHRPTWAWALAAEHADDATVAGWQELSSAQAAGQTALLYEKLARRLDAARELPRQRLERALAALSEEAGALPSFAALADAARSLEEAYV